MHLNKTTKLKQRITKMPKNKAVNSLIFEIDSYGNLIGIQKYNNAIQKLKIPEGIKRINRIEYNILNNLKLLTLPSSLQEVSFSYSLPKKIKIANHSPVLFDWWVKNHKYDGKTLSEMEEINLEKYTNSDDKPFTIIENNCLRCYNKNLKKFNTGSFVTEIRDISFINYKDLIHVEIGKNVRFIDDLWFSGCTKLKPENVINHSPVLFKWWVENHKYSDKTLSEMKTIDLDKYTNSDGKPFTKINVDFNSSHSIQEFVTGLFVNEIKIMHFWSCPNLQRIEIGKNVRSIYYFDFADCPKLKSENVISRSPVLFNWWVENHKYDGKTLSEMETIDLDKYTNSDGKPFTKIGSYSFSKPLTSSDLNLQKFNTGPFITEIKWNAFADCKNLKHIEIGKNVQSIDSEIFNNCPNLKTVISHSPVLFNWWVNNHKYNGKTLSEMETIDLDKYTNSDGKPFTDVSKFVFTSNTKTKNVLFGDNIEQINETIFSWNNNLKNIQITNKNILLNPKAFEYVSKSVNFYVRDEQIKEKLEAIGIDSKQIFVKPISKEELEESKENKIELTC